MGFFKDFKNDLSQAVNELLPEEELKNEDTDEQIVNTLDSKETEGSDEIKELLDGFTFDEDQDGEPTDMQKDGSDADDEAHGMDSDSKQEAGSLENDQKADNLGNEQEVRNTDKEKDELKIEEEIEDMKAEKGSVMNDNVDLELLDALNDEEETEVPLKDEPVLKAQEIEANDGETTVIAKGTKINGSISSDCSLDIKGSITGDVECMGKLTITGKVVGNSIASEVYVNTERMEGNITAEGSVKVGLGTVVVGDITASAGVIAGAVKGEIDINGPIVIDSTAIVKGNIKAKAVQINNGAVIEGFCSLSYSDVDVDNIFE